VDPEGEADAGADAPQVVFTGDRRGADEDQVDRALHVVDVLRSMVTGYDVSGDHARELLAEYVDLCSPFTEDCRLLGAELRLLSTFADLCGLSRNRPIAGDEPADASVHCPREHFHALLLSLDVEREGLPEGVRDNISRALRHYGVLDLDLADDTDGAVLTALGESVYRIFLSQQRMDNQIPVIAEMLSRWLPEEQGGCGTPVPPESFAEVLDRLIGATQLRFPVIGDAARTLRFRLYDQPRIDEARRDAMDRIRGVLTRLASAAPDEDEYTAQITRLAQTPVPLSD